MIWDLFFDRTVRYLLDEAPVQKKGGIDFLSCRIIGSCAKCLWLTVLLFVFHASGMPRFVVNDSHSYQDFMSMLAMPGFLMCIIYTAPLL